MLKIVAVFNKKDPIIVGIDVERGTLKVGTPVCVFNESKLKLGIVESIERDHKKLNEAKKETGSVAIRIKGPDNIDVGRQF